MTIHRTFLLVALAACASPTSSQSPQGKADAPSGSDASDAAQSGSQMIPLTIASYAGDNGKMFLLPVSVNGRPAVDVLVDTGSVGLRLFAQDLVGANVNVTSEACSAEFGNGDTLVGRVATAMLDFGGVAAPAPIAFQFVESFRCASGSTDCDLASGTAAYYTQSGIHGILGIGLRPGDPAALYNPLAQLGYDRFAIVGGTFTATTASIELEGDVTSFTTRQLPSAGMLPNHMAAWADDGATACFHLAGAAVNPPCTDVIFDTGSNLDVIYAPHLPASQLDSGMLASGLAFEASSPAFNIAFTTGTTPSRDLVLVDTTEAFALLGIGAFLRDDISYDLMRGEIGFRHHP